MIENKIISHFELRGASPGRPSGKGVEGQWLGVESRENSRQKKPDRTQSLLIPNEMMA